MTSMQLNAPRSTGMNITRLTDADAPEMLTLATLTEPGPFFSRTNELGDFAGLRIHDQLVAMAGERMKPEGYTEVSGVCTNPDHRGRGYAGSLMHLVSQKSSPGARHRFYMPMPATRARSLSTGRWVSHPAQDPDDAADSAKLSLGFLVLGHELEH